MKFELKDKNDLNERREKFIEIATFQHGDKYDYSFIKKFKKNSDKVDILCKSHGKFKQNATEHMSGNGCPRCNNSFTKTTEDFIKDAQKLHGNTYDYSKTKYVNSKTKVIIICKKHGEFLQNPSCHTIENGCPECKSKKSNKETLWLDSLNNKNIKRQYDIFINDKKYIVDGYDKKTNTIYEYFGDYYHGNIKEYCLYKNNPTNQKSYKELYDITINRIKLFEENGYNVIYTWEKNCDKIMGKKLKKSSAIKDTIHYCRLWQYADSDDGYNYSHLNYFLNNDNFEPIDNQSFVSPPETIPQ